MRRFATTVLCVLLLASLAAAQSDDAKKKGAPAKKAAGQGPPMPAPAPELKRLAYFAGNWTIDGTMSASDFGPGGKFKFTEHNEWFPGKFFLVTHTTGTMEGLGSMRGLSIFGYDTAKKVYTYRGINSVGEAEESSGTVSGADWNWTSDSTRNGKNYKNKFMVHEDSPTSYTMKFDMSTDGGRTWQTVMEGKATKGAAKPPAPAQ